METRKFNKLIAIATIATTMLCCSCKKQIINAEAFTDIEWSLDSTLVIRNDSAFSYSKYDAVLEEFTSPVLFPLSLTDSTMILTRYQPTGTYDDKNNFVANGCELTCDTIKYDIKYINKCAKLVLYTEPFPLILSTNKRLEIKETNNFKPIKFIISDFSIGDQIDRSLLKTVGVYNYNNYTIEDCKYSNDKNLNFKIIGYNHIFSIERKKIEDYQVKEIINVVTDKLGSTPDYRPMRQWTKDSDYEFEFYRWATQGVRIDLTRSKYIGTEAYKTLINNNWNLSYDDVVQQAILIETYKNGRPHSNIIN